MKIKNEDLVNYSIVSFGLYPIMPNKLKGVFIIFLFLSILSYFLKKGKRNFNLKPFLINSSLFLIYLISMTYTIDMYNGFKKLGPGISIIIFPLVFYILLGNFQIERKVIIKLLNLFSFSTFLFISIYFFHLLFIDRPQNPYFDFPTNIFFRNSIIKMPVLGHHPIYSSLFIGVSIINISRLFVLFYSKKNKIILFILTIVLLLKFSTLFILSSKGAILALIIVSVFIFHLKSKNITQVTLFGIGAITLLIVSILIFPQTKNRFNELFKTDTYSFNKLDENNSSQIRIAIWKTSINNIKKSPIFGYGIGDVKEVLNSSYKNKHPFLLEEQYNSHNQFLGIWLSTGIIGVIIFIYFLFFNFTIGIQNKDYILLAILLFFCLNFLTENIIERQAGATLFFFFINLFGFYNYSKSLNISKSKRNIDILK